MGLSIARACRLLGLPVATYYYNLTRIQRPAPCQEQVLQACQSFPEYGYRRIYVVLHGMGFPMGRNKIRTVMKKLGLQPKKKKPRTSYARLNHNENLNLIAPGQARQPGQILGSDASWIPMGRRNGLYIAVTLDLCTRQVLGYALSPKLDTRLVLVALAGAVAGKRPAREWIHHSDRGCTYTSNEFLACLSAVGGKPSYSDPGKPQQNGIVESFFKTLKTEELAANEYPSPAHLIQAIRNYIHNYNQNRIHSSLNYRTPDQFEKAFAQG